MTITEVGHERICCLLMKLVGCIHFFCLHFLYFCSTTVWYTLNSRAQLETKFYKMARFNLARLAGVLLLLTMLVLGDDSTSVTDTTTLGETSPSETSVSTTTSSSSSSTTTSVSTTTTSSVSSSTTTSARQTSSSSSSNSSSNSKSLPALTTSSSKSSSSSSSSSVASSTNSTLTSSTSTNSTSSVTSMPKLEATSSSTSPSSSSSSSSITFTPVVPTDIDANPNIHMETLPSGLTFIAVGSALVLVFGGLIFARLILSCVSSRRARTTALSSRDDELYNYDPELFAKSKNISAPSVYSFGSSSTMNYLGSQTTVDHINPGTQGGKTYWNSVTRASRSSLFISPTELLTLGISNFGDSVYDNVDNSPIDSPSTAYFDQVSNNQIPPKHKRPPSVYMEKLFDDSLSLHSDTSSENYDHVHEKV